MSQSLRRGYQMLALNALSKQRITKAAFPNLVRRELAKATHARTFAAQDDVSEWAQAWKLSLTEQSSWNAFVSTEPDLNEMRVKAAELIGSECVLTMEQAHVDAHKSSLVDYR